ncbi:MAG: hypothetical protein KAI47_25575 [Deltaproteobacteria bacterium]|nr:hypothetical protein [Deltaproteobacteria bacterium]
MRKISAFSLLYPVALVGLVTFLSGCGARSGITLGGFVSTDAATHDVSPHSKDAYVPRRDAAPRDTAPHDITPGCGVSWLDGSLATPYFTLGCPPDNNACPVTTTTTLHGKTGFHLTDSRDCAPHLGYMLTARLILKKTSKVSLSLKIPSSHPVPITATTAFRDLCQLRQCSTNHGYNLMLLDPGEYTLEVATSRPTDFDLRVTISPF